MYPYHLYLIICTLAANVSPAWQTAYTKAKAAVANLTLGDKVSLGTGMIICKNVGDRTSRKLIIIFVPRKGVATWKVPF